MKHKSTISLRSQIANQLSGRQQVDAVQSNQRRKHLQARFWPPYFRIQQRKHRIVREALESVYHSNESILMNEVEFYLKVVVL